MANVTHKGPCDRCSSSDAMATYDDGGTYCFSCQTSTKGDDDMEPTKKVNKITPMIECGRFMGLESRRISKETCEFFSYQVGSFTGMFNGEMMRDEQLHIANYCDEFGEIVAQKLRASGKRISTRGDGKKMSLYGQWKYQPTEKLFITVTEGEIDCLSVAEAQGKQFPVVSIPKGAGAAKKAIQENLEWLQGFKYVVLGFDNDEAGKAATKECVDLFEPGKVRIAKWSLKDPNDLLVAGRRSEIKDALWQAQEIRPDKICGPADVLQNILVRPDTGVEWPWKAFTQCTLGLREKQLILLGAAPGIGKSEMVKDIVLHCATVANVPSGIFSFEQDVSETMQRLIGGMLNKKLHLPGDWWDPEAIKEKAKLLEGKVFAYDSWGGAKVEDIAPKMRYLAKAHGVKLFVIDHLTALAAKMDGDERRGIEKAMELLASLTRELKCSIILVSHLARDKKQGHTKEDGWGHGRKPALENFKGSGAIESWADAVFGLSRNADSTDEVEKRVLKVECLKARLDGSKRGYSFALIYNNDTGKLDEMQGGVE